jgi:hypothetical protein
MGRQPDASFDGNLDSSTNQVLAVGPGVGGVSFSALHVISLFFGISVPG